MRGLAIAAVLAVASPAYADYPDEAGPLPSSAPRWEAGLSPSAGVVEAQQGHGAEGARLHGGVELGRVAALAEVELYHLDSSCDGCADPGSGAGHELRVGADFRYDVLQARVLHKARGGRGRYERLDVWIDAGLGDEMIAIGDAATRSRMDIAAGAGLSLTNRAGGLSCGLRVRFELARPYGDGAIAPDVATREASGLDPTFLVGFVFGFGS